MKMRVCKLICQECDNGFYHLADVMLASTGTWPKNCPDCCEAAQSQARGTTTANAVPELLSVAKELFALLEEHEPVWYLRGHYNRARAAIAKAEGV